MVRFPNNRNFVQAKIHKLEQIERKGTAMKNVRVEIEGAMPTGKRMMQTLVELLEDQYGVKTDSVVRYDPDLVRKRDEEKETE